MSRMCVSARTDCGWPRRARENAHGVYRDVWNAATGQETLMLKGHTNWVLSVCFSPDGTRLASASFDHTVKVWDVSTGQKMLTLKGPIEDVFSTSEYLTSLFTWLLTDTARARH